MRFVVRWRNGFWRVLDTSESYGYVDPTREIGRPYFERQADAEHACEWLNAHV